MAAAKISHESGDQTLQATALVHEAWIRLSGNTSQSWENRAQFFATAAVIMQRILIDNARRKQALRRGGGAVRVSADITGFDVAETPDNDSLLLVNDAMDALAAHDSRKADLVRYRYFVGLSLAEAADLLGISQRTAERDWSYARAWLLREVNRIKQLE